MTDLSKGLFSLGHAIISKSRLSNAMGVPLVFVVVVFLGGLAGYMGTRNNLFFWVMLLPIGFFILTFMILVIFKPALLRTEEHEERMMQLASGMGEQGAELDRNGGIDMTPTIPEAVTGIRKLDK